MTYEAFPTPEEQPELPELELTIDLLTATPDEIILEADRLRGIADLEEAASATEEERTRIRKESWHHQQLLALETSMVQMITEHPAQGWGLFNALRTHESAQHRLHATDFIIPLLTNDVKGVEPNPSRTLEAWKQLIGDENSTVSYEAQELIFDVLHPQSTELARNLTLHQMSSILWHLLEGDS